MKSNISTIWADKSSGIPLSKYPRPQLARESWTNLNGHWDYAVSEIGSDTPDEYTGEILVPFSMETAAGGVCRKFGPDECLHYRKFFNLDRNEGKRTILNFEAVDWKCSVAINGSQAGSHTGGYIPFSFDITELVHDGENELRLSVTDPTDSHWQQRGKQALHPGSIWYTPTSGIWQTVWLEEVPENYIEALRITQGENPGHITLEVLTHDDIDCSVNVYADGILKHSSVYMTNQPIHMDLENPRLWSPDDPFLHDLEIYAGEDCVKSYFGLRTISLTEGPAEKNMMLLNGLPFFINGPLDQGYWPESGMTQPSDEAIVFDLQSMKDLGFNTIRKHIKVESRRWYYHADRLGLAVIQDMPSGGREMTGYLRDVLGITSHHMQPDNDSAAYESALRESPESRKSYEDELEEMIVHLHNHPSIIIWCPFNEAWGQFDSVRIYEFTKQLDPSRLVDHASGWFDQGSGDFRSIHTYKKKLEVPPADDKRAYLISEYGGYNYIDRHHLWRDDDTFGYKYYKTPHELTSAYEDLVNSQVIPLISEGLCGVIYTQLSDVEIETNGIHTYDRKVLKFSPQSMKKAHQTIYKAFYDLIGKKNINY